MTKITIETSNGGAGCPGDVVYGGSGGSGGTFRPTNAELGKGGYDKHDAREVIQRQRAEIRELKASSFQERMKAAVAALEKPVTPYRLVRNTEKGTWSAQKWRVHEHEPAHDKEAFECHLHRIRHGLAYPSTRNMSAFWDYDSEAKAEVVWEAFGPIAEFDTYDLALAWLRGWLQPINAEVYITEEGSTL